MKRGDLVPKIEALLRETRLAQDRGEPVGDQLSHEYGISFMQTWMSAAHIERNRMRRAGVSVHEAVESQNLNGNGIEVSFPERDVRGPS